MALAENTLHLGKRFVYDEVIERQGAGLGEGGSIPGRGVQGFRIFACLPFSRIIAQDGTEYLESSQSPGLIVGGAGMPNTVVESGGYHSFPSYIPIARHEYRERSKGVSDPNDGTLLHKFGWL